MNKLQRNGRMFVVGALALSLAACGGEEVEGSGPYSPANTTPSASPANTPGNNPAPTGNVPPATGTSTILDSVEVPTTDEAYDAVRDTIQEENVDEELERLMKEIEEGN